MEPLCEPNIICLMSESRMEFVDSKGIVKWQIKTFADGYVALQIDLHRWIKLVGQSVKL